MPGILEKGSAMNAKVWVSLSALALCHAGKAADKHEWWVLVSSDPEGEFHAVEGSFQQASKRNGERVAMIFGKSYDKLSNTLWVERLYVRIRDCESMQGKLVVMTADSQPRYEADFVLGAGTAAARKAGYICSQLLKDKPHQLAAMNAMQ
jgi:hypothetical protein